jgi:hypothetical protein
MKSCGVLDWQKVPKEGTVGHHEALRVLLKSQRKKNRAHHLQTTK